MDIHVVLADGAPLRNLETAVRGAYLDVGAIVAAPVATALACLSDEERDLGVALVELGAGVTNVSLHIGGMLVGLRSIPIGAADITDDIASSFGIRRSQAERMKCFYGSASQNPRDFRETIEIAPVTSSGEKVEPRKVTRGTGRRHLRAARAHHERGLQRPQRDGIPFAGRPSGRTHRGGAELKGIADYAQTALGRAVRIGRPREIEGLPDAHRGPAFSTLVGLAFHAATERVDLRFNPAAAQAVTRLRWTDAVRRMFSTMKTQY